MESKPKQLCSIRNAVLVNNSLKPYISYDLENYDKKNLIELTLLL